MTETLRLALVADIHHGPEHQTKRGPAALGLLDAFLDFVREWGPDAVIDLGDRVSDIAPDEDRARLAEVAARFQGLNTPRFHLDGNHDVAFMGAEDNAGALGKAPGHASVDIKGRHLVLWNADCRIPWPETFRFRPSDLDWLARDLAATDLPTIVLSHVPLGGGAMTGNMYFQRNPEFGGYPDGAAVREVLASTGHVVLGVAGHVHWNGLHTVDGVPHLTLQSLTESFTTDGAPAGAWATLEVDDEIRWRVYGRDPIALTLPLRPRGRRWVAPLAPIRERRRERSVDGRLAGVKAVILDFDGVLYRDDEPIAGAPEFVRWARAAGLGIAGVTNNARRSADDYARKLARMGIDIPAAAIVTAGEDTARMLAARAPGATVFVAGPEALGRELIAAGLVEGEPPDFVVAGMDPEMTVARLARAAVHLRNGALLVVSNPDRTHPTPAGLEPEAGAVQAFLEAAGGKPAEACGKPGAGIFRLALDRLGTAPGETLMVGDTLMTDILGANRAGLLSAHVLTGNPAEGAPEAEPTVRVADLAELQAVLTEALGHD